MPPIWNALIRTHHITSRKKVAKLRAAASNYNVYALLRSGGCPGIMYCEGAESGVKDWVSSVQGLRYKDFQLATRPAAKQQDGLHREEIENAPPIRAEFGKLEEVESVKEFGSRMQGMGAWGWWRRGMGYANEA